MSDLDRFTTRFDTALGHRKGLLKGTITDACRVFSGQADGWDGIFVDRYGPGAVLIEYKGRKQDNLNIRDCADLVLERLKPYGVQAVYYKPFVRDRSRLSGQLPPETTDATPLSGRPLPEGILIREHVWKLEIRLYDGLSTGLFLDQRNNRQWVYERVRRRDKVQILNTFAYTCGFSVAAAVGGAHTTSVDVSARYLEWAKRNFEHNGLDPLMHRFVRMDTLEFLAYAQKKNLKYDLVILDPPSFASGNKRKKVRPWSAVSDYPKLIEQTMKVLKPGGAVLASTNTQALCRENKLQRMIQNVSGRRVRWVELPPVPEDFSREQDRFRAVAFELSQAV
ncbi:MAG: hypothetical protein KatS3mg104_1112 [Phycisphaerae bacterium]|nr:MAG: hypothetical protein KatS3mg104_1112 [Phycisphaerae bacterium]